MGWRYPPLYGKHEGRDERKVAKLDKKIKSLQEDKAIYEKRIAERKSQVEPKKA